MLQGNRIEMKRKFNAKITEELIRKAMSKYTTYIEQTKGCSNPQVVELRNFAEGQLQAYESILDALHGDLVMLRIAAETH